MKFKFKNFGLLELIVTLSGVYVISMLIWTASTRLAVETKLTWLEIITIK